MLDGINADIGSTFQEISHVASLLRKRGFGESFFGNISVLTRNYSIPGEGERYPLPSDHPDLDGSLLIMTRTGSTMAGIASDPEENIGAYILSGSEGLLINGAGPPSSEIGSHLEAHSKVGLPRSAVIHCHVGKMLYVLERTDPLPDWIRIVPRLPPGSTALARATGQAARQDVLMIWRGHGIVSISRTLSEAYEVLERGVSMAGSE